MSTVANPEPVSGPRATTPAEQKLPTGTITPRVDSGNASSTSKSKLSSRASSLMSFGKNSAASSVSSHDKIKLPFAEPLPECKPAVPPDLTPEQETKYAKLLAVVSTWSSIPTSTASNAATAPITDDERMWLTRECLLRYLRATKWSSTEAPKRLLATLAWKREYKVNTFTPDYISPENETGKQVQLGFDNEGRPCLYLNPAKQNTEKSERQIQHLVFMLDRAIDMMPPGQETCALLINFKDGSSGSNPSVGQGNQTLNILQGHYPERLGRALISELPWYVTTFFKLISPLIDQVTKTKMKFNEDLRLHVPPAQLQKAYGGDADFEYDHSVYWPAWNALCDERRREWKQRWVSGGKKAGEYEEYLRGGQCKSLAQQLEEAQAALDENGDDDFVDAVEDLKIGN